jgi:tetratricopeptide (TPR) repeat protein
MRALPRLLLQANDAEGAVAVLEAHRDRTEGPERAERDVELAELYLDRLSRPKDALEAAVRALDGGDVEPRAVSVLERLMEIDPTRERAAQVLATRYASSGEARREAQALGVMLERAGDRGERLELFGRLAAVHEEKLGAFGTALDVVLRAVREFPAELGLWDRADQLAAAAGRPTELAEAYRETLRGSLPREVELELCDRAARLHEDKLGDPMGATPYLERVLTLDPGNEHGFDRLREILTAAERWSELEALYDRAAAATPDPVRRAEMLGEVALVCEDILEDRAKATRYYERILEIDPLHDAAIRALDRLYASQERHADLASLLERRLETAAEERLDLQLRLGRLMLERLHQPARAIGPVEDVLRERPNDYDARELAEKLLEIGDLRARAARMLESVYEARDEVRDLVRVLDIRLETLDAEIADATAREEEQKELLRRVARLRADRLLDDQGALAAFARLVPADPLDAEARERLQQIGRRVGAHERVAEVLAEAAERADTRGMRGEILMQVARIYEDLLGDTRRAEATYRRVLELDPDDAELALPAARALGRIYVASGEHEKLAEILRSEVKLEQDGEARRDLLGRLGELCQRVLGDVQGAIEAWRARVEENPTDELGLSALDRLYEQTGKWRELVEVIERRKDNAETPAARRTLLVRSAEVLGKRIASVHEAIEAWRAVRDEFGADAEVLIALEDLYRAARRWEDLEETLSSHLDVASGPARLDLLAQLGDLRREHLGNLSGALDAYREALTVDAAHAPSRGALERLLGSEDPIARREAAEVLHPIYETEGAHQRLLETLEIEVDTTDDPVEKLERLGQALRVAEGPLGDAKRAFGYAERALRTALGHTELAPWLAHLERLAAATDSNAEHVALLREIVPDIFDGEAQLAVTLKIAAIARDKLADRALAREYYQEALELRAEDRSALVALESLYEESGDAPSLLGILERRTEVAESDAEKKQLLFRRARLLADVIEDHARAIEAYESILDLSLDPKAIEALDGLYAREQRWVDLIGLYERQLEQAPADPAALRVKIAVVAARHQSDLGRAFDEIEAALALDRQHAGAIGELERLLSEAPEAEHRARAAALLEPVYLLRADFSRVMDTIRARLETTDEPSERRELLTRLAQLYEEQKEDYVAALETTAKLLAESLDDDATIAELERLAKVAGAEKRLAEIFAGELEKLASDDPASARLARRTGELFASLGELERALSFYRRALGFEPESRSLFESIDELLTRTSRHEQRVELYRDALEHRFEPSERLATLHTIAGLQRRELAAPDQAIETYRLCLDVDDQDERALDALTELYRQRERWDDLGELYLRRAEGADNPMLGAGHRLALARLCRAQLGNVERAIDQLEEIVRSSPMHGEAIRELESLLDDATHRERVVEILRPIYQQADDWRHLITLNEDRFELAQDPGEKVSVLRETARLWEERGGDQDRARGALGLAVDLDPDDAEVRSEYERLCEATRAWDELAETYEAVLGKHADLASKRDLLATLARVHDVHRDDPRRALDVYDRLRATDEGDIEPLRKMEQLATLLSDWPALVRVLGAMADLLLDDAERASVWRRVGEARRDMLEDAHGAIEAYERALELEADSAFTVDCLIGLYEGKRDAARLVELYQRRVELCDEDDADLKYELLTSAATAYESQLDDRSKAIEQLQRALSTRPGDRAVLQTLNRLYRAEEQWPDLLDNLRLEASTAPSAGERAALRKQIGEILAEKLSSWEDALEAYRAVLDETPEDAQAVAAARRIGQEHEDLRAQVAEILIPVLRQTERWQDLVEALEMRLSVETEPGARAETLRTVAEAQESRLGRPADALGALLRALAETPEAADLHADVERLAAASDGWSRYADALEERAQSTFDADVGRDLWSRLGRVAEERLKDDRRAVSAYKRAIEQAGDQPELLEALDRLHGRLGDHQALAEILERRVAASGSDAQLADLYHRMAALQIREFKEPARGLASLRQALDRQADHEGALRDLEALTSERDLFEEAAEILESVYRARGRSDRLAALYEKRISFADSPGARVDMRRSLARVLEEDVRDPGAAQRVLQQGLLDDPADSALLAEIERLAPLTGNWEGAAAALRDAVDQKTDLLPDVARDLCVRVAIWQRDRAESSAAAERALARALEFDPQSDEVLVSLEQLQRVPGRERDLVATLRRRAKLQPDDERREDLFRQARALCEGLGDAALGEAILRELLGHDDQNPWALAELSQVRLAAGDFKEAFELLVKRAGIAADGATARRLRHEAAAIARDRLSQPAQAIELYEQLFEDEPQDGEAAGALRQLYEASKSWQKLSGLLARLIDLAESPAARSSLRIELARLSHERFKAVDQAIELLKTVLEEEPSRSEAVVALSELYEASGRDEDLASLLHGQIEAARERRDVDAELAFEVRLGDVYESRLKNRPRAIETYRAVLERDPRHPGALEALARLYQAEKNHSEAAQILERLLELASGADTVRLAMVLADEHMKLGDAASSARALERGLGADARHPELRGRLRKLYESMSAWEPLAGLIAGDADAAAEVAEKIKLLEAAADIHAKKRGDHHAAAALLEQASALKADDRELLLRLCDAYSASGRGKAAADVLEKIVESYGTKRSKDLAEIHRRLADAYLADGAAERALGELDKAFRIEPGNVGVLRQLGLVSLDAGDLKKAQQMFRALLLQKLDDHSPIGKAEVFLHLGDIHEKLGEKDKAVQMFERSVQTDAAYDLARQRLAAARAK